MVRIDFINLDDRLYSSGVRKGVTIQEIGRFGGPNPWMAQVCWIGTAVTVIFGALLAVFNCIESN